MVDAHSNFAYSLVATAPSPATSGTSLVVTAGQGALFPAVPFNATIWPTAAQPLSTTAEIVRVTTVSTDTLTITRAQEGTSAWTVVVGDQIAATITAKTLTDVESVNGAGVFGDGNDGTQTFDGSTTILGMAPSSSIYTLARDIFLASSTINSGVSIITAGYRIFCTGTMTNNGTIKWNGAVGVLGGAGGAATVNAVSSIGSGTVGAAGGAGSTTNGGNGVSAGNSLGGNSGQGGNGGTGTGGVGRSATAPTASKLPPRSIPVAVRMWTFDPSFTAVQLLGGASGGGGGGDNTNIGGGGGAGGGAVGVFAKTFAGTGAIQARGGAGGNGAATGNTGGGGGGGGGFVIVISSSVSGGAISGQTIDAAGGALGTKHGTGTDGVGGSAGSVILIPN